MKRSSKNIRTVIKATGLEQRSNVVGRTFAVFRVDATKHLLSLVSKIKPSPDWIVGVSMENLCLPNDTWVDSRVIDLYPWDAGTNSGLSYQVRVQLLNIWVLTFCYRILEQRPCQESLSTGSPHATLMMTGPPSMMSPVLPSSQWPGCTFSSRGSTTRSAAVT